MDPVILILTDEVSAVGDFVGTIGDIADSFGIKTLVVSGAGLWTAKKLIDGAIAQRGEGEPRPSGDVLLAFGPLELRLLSREVWMAVRGGTRLPLTALEFDLLCALVRADGDPVCFDSLLNDVWKDPLRQDSIPVRSCVRRLRRKLRAHRVPVQIETVRGLGFRVTATSNEPTVSQLTQF